MKKQGRVISIPIKDAKEGMQVIKNGNVQIIRSVDANDSNYVNFFVPKGGVHLTHISELKQLVVDWDDKGGTPMLPLKYSQWQAAIDAGEVDSDKVVEFEIVHPNSTVEQCKPMVISNTADRIAKIIPTAKKIYTEDEAKTIARTAFHMLSGQHEDQINILFEDWWNKTSNRLI